MQEGKPTVWFVCYPKAEMRVRIYRTGESPTPGGNHVGTAVFGKIEFHAFSYTRGG